MTIKPGLVRVSKNVDLPDHKAEVAMPQLADTQVTPKDYTDNPAEEWKGTIDLIDSALLGRTMQAPVPVSLPLPVDTSPIVQKRGDAEDIAVAPPPVLTDEEQAAIAFPYSKTQRDATGRLWILDANGYPMMVFGYGVKA